MLGRPDLVGQTVGRVLAGPTESRGGPNPPKATRFPRQDSVGQTGGPTGSRTAGWTESDGRAAAGRSDGPDPSPTGSDSKVQPSLTNAKAASGRTDRTPVRLGRTGNSNQVERKRPSTAAPSGRLAVGLSRTGRLLRGLAVGRASSMEERLL